MPSIQVKDFPQELYDQLKAYAERERRSMAQQLIVAAEQMLRADALAETNAPDAQASAGGCSAEVGNNAEQARRARAAKRSALFARIDASIREAKNKGSWSNTTPDVVAVLQDTRAGRSRHIASLSGATAKEANA